MGDLNSILQYIRIKDALPHNSLLKFVNDFHKFAAYFLLPFIRVVPQNESPMGPKKLELWSQPNDLIDKKM